MNVSTEKTLGELYKMFKALNARYWDYNLPTPVIIIASGESKDGKFYGRYYPEKWTEKIEEEEINPEMPVYHEITISAENLNRPIKNIAATLQHELVHYYCFLNGIRETSNRGRYHNKKFLKVGEEVGLNLDCDQVFGHAITQPSSEFTEFIESLNIDEEAFKFYRIPTPEKVKKPYKKKRFVCPVCALEISAKEGTNLICGECGYRMDYWNLTEITAPVLLVDYNDGLSVSEKGWCRPLDEDIDDFEDYTHDE